MLIVPACIYYHHVVVLCIKAILYDDSSRVWQVTTDGKIESRNRLSDFIGELRGARLSWRRSHGLATNVSKGKGIAQRLVRIQQQLNESLMTGALLSAGVASREDSPHGSSRSLFRSNPHGPVQRGDLRRTTCTTVGSHCFHHLLNVFSPSRQWSVGQQYDLALLKQTSTSQSP